MKVSTLCNFDTCPYVLNYPQIFISTEHSTKLTWTGENLGTCKDARFKFSSKKVEYRMIPKFPKLICPKDVTIKIENALPYLHYFDCCYHGPSHPGSPGDDLQKFEDMKWEARQGSYCTYNVCIHILYSSVCAPPITALW